VSSLPVALHSEGTPARGVAQLRFVDRSAHPEDLLGVLSDAFAVIYGIRRENGALREN
jgi:hypothetical protein